MESKASVSVQSGDRRDKVAPFPRSRRTSQQKTAVAPVGRPEAWQVADSLLDSFRYAGMGFWYACRTQRNFRIHLCVSAIAISSSLWLNLPAVEMALVGLTCGLVLILELLNTALEAVVDLTVGDRYHPLAKIAKDCAAAAVLVAAAVSVLVAAFLLLPPFVLQMGWF